ncbi:MAG TPA: OmpA family protein [Bacteroidales bacterium]
MRTIRTIIQVSACLWLVTSCVPVEKFTASQNEAKKYREQDSVLEAKNFALTKLSDSLMLQMANYSKRLDEKQRKLDKAQTSLDRLQKMVKQEREEMTSTSRQIQEALKSFAPSELSVRERNGELYVSMYEKLLFPTGKDAVNERGKAALSKLADVLKTKSIQIMVEGHTDDVPINNRRFKDNWDLSVHRATNVTRILIDDGIKPGRIIASGRGEYHPPYSNKTMEGRKFNRRTDIVLVPKLEKLWSLLEEENKSNAERSHTSFLKK